MYISIDMNTMRILCKHPNFMYCWDYSIIAVGDDFNVFPIDNVHCWKQFTPLEIQTLYIEMTGNEKGLVLPSERCREVLIQYCMELPETKINHTVHAQAQYCVDNDKYGLRYIYGADAPSANSSLWVTAPYSDTLELNAPNKELWLPPEQPAFKAPREHTGSSTSTAVPRLSAQRSATPRTTERPARSGACARIWEVADELWKADPQPALIKQIKKDAKIALVAEGINPSTCSVQLSKWQKEKGL